MSALQWGGRFAAEPNSRLLAFGSSLEEDLVLAPFDVACSIAHVEALRAGGIVGTADAAALAQALHAIEAEVANGQFASYARALPAEDIHGAIDARVREIAGPRGEWLHAGRSRNDQVATTLLLYVRDRGWQAAQRCREIAAAFVERAREELDAETLLAGCTHCQPAQPVLLAFILAAWSEPFLRSRNRLQVIAAEASTSSPLGSAALAGSTLPLDRERAAEALGFAAPSRNALYAIGNRDAALDLAHACVRALVDLSRIVGELISWSSPAYGYVRLGDAASTGSSLMPQKRNPDSLELLRARAAKLVGSYCGALATLCGLAPSYQRDLQETKALTLSIVEQSLEALDVFIQTWSGVAFVRERMRATALDGYTIATDIADALIAKGVSARKAHALVGLAVARAERQNRPLEERDLAYLASEIGVETVQAALDPRASVGAKRTGGSTAPGEVHKQIASLEAELEELS
jgi:argininosuccinate lyase